METIFQLITTGFLTGIVYALMALGLSIIFGLMGLINFAHGDFVMLAMYGGFFFCHFSGLDPYSGLLVVVPLFFVLGAGIYRGLFRHLLDAPEESQIIATFGLSFVLQYGAMLFFSTEYRSVVTKYADQILSLGFLTVDFPHIFSTLITGILLALIFLFLYFTNTGRAIRAVSEQRRGASLIGIHVQKIYTIAIGLGFSCVAFSGTALITFESVHPTIGTHFNLLCWVIVVLGGVGSLWGTVIGAIIIAEMEMIIGFFFAPVLTTFAYFVIFLAILMIRPAGLFGYVERRA